LIGCSRIDGTARNFTLLIGGTSSFWQEFFGVGLVKTAEDFGIMGEAPSNALP
jgi:hypothetical protein